MFTQNFYENVRFLGKIQIFKLDVVVVVILCSKVLEELNHAKKKGDFQATPPQ
jgi:hypothetical protein